MRGRIRFVHSVGTTTSDLHRECSRTRACWRMRAFLRMRILPRQTRNGLAAAAHVHKRQMAATGFVRPHEGICTYSDGPPHSAVRTLSAGGSYSSESG